MDPLAEEISVFITAAPKLAREEEFNRLACALFRRQVRGCAPLSRLCDGLGVVPEAVSHWTDIPAVPAQAFKSFTLSCTQSEQAAAVFHSSGTTAATASRHVMDRDALALYETSLRRGIDLAIVERPDKLWGLMAAPGDAPHSSLSHMVGALGAERFFWDDNEGLAEALSALRVPTTLFGTAFAFLALFDDTRQSWRMPPGSVVIETGGFKGRTREVSPAELYRLFGERLGVPESRCWSEYGMCELASQFYSHGPGAAKRGPHWVRTRTIDPATGGDVAAGRAGLLRHYDLANFNSAVALQTQDQGVLVPGGFLLQGRASGAEVRGCSLTVEELWTPA